MANSRIVFTQKASYADASTSTAQTLAHTFSPDRGFDTWQARLFWTSGGQGSMKFETLDGDGDAIEIDGSPFAQASGDVEITLDSSNESLRVTMTSTSAGATPAATVKVKAWRVFEATGRGYATAETAV